MPLQHWWAIIVFIELCFFASNSQTLTCHPRDLGALQDFIAQLEPKPEGWVLNPSADCCRWVGVTCNSSSSLGLNDPNNTGRVTKLELVNRRLVGMLSESLGRLDQIRVLNLSHNFITDSVPLSIFDLVNLEALDLSSNDLYGQIPDSINLPSLQILDLSSNALNGSLPTHVCHNSSKITLIRLAVNYFSGDFLSGFGKCTVLEHLCFGMNNLTGNIPEDVFQLQRLNLLGIQDNKLSGLLSPAIGNLSSLVRLDISSNRFSGEIPDVFDRLPRFQYLIAHSNRFTGGIPSSLSNSRTLSLLNLRNNSLSGALRLNCAVMTNLASLDLGTNKFNGPLPENLPSCMRLRNVNLARNALHGELPESFKNFQGLSYLSLSNSSFVNISSALRTLQHCKNLTTLVLTLNFYGEALPDDPSLHFENLKVLVVANCRLIGSMPSWLSKSTNLQLLDLSWNRLTGAVPSWIGDFTDLFYLDLSNNSFTGEIPKSLTGLASLINRTISLDEPSPDFPFFMKRNESARALQYNQIFRFPPTLELGHNNLSGPIWEEFGNLKKLHVFDLRMNGLSGPIPSALSGMTSLEILDLSNNYLSGPIPASLQNLTFLSKFSVAYNNLSGKIPSGGQFQTFPNSSFEGNSLCGMHLLPCQADTSDGVSRTSVKRSGTKGTVIGMAVGIAFGTVFLLALLSLIALRAHKRGEVDPEKEEPDSANHKELEEIGSKVVVLFQNKENNTGDLSLNELLDSTNNFDQANIIGCGGFALVYRATLPDGTKVAIKRLSGDCGQMEREFRAEVETLSRALHPNLVHLQGYCFYKNDRLLIYSYMENGSLDYWLHEKVDGPALLDWNKRLRIAQGSARGLAYLHQACDPHILHRDIKSSNILLDENFESHLADFGLARLICPYETHITTDLVGTLGYIPPEYGQASVATYKGDVYSFGVVLLELLTGKRPMDMCKPKGSRDLISWVMRMKNENRASEVFDPFIYDKENDKQMLRVLEIACLCLSENPKVRPTTQQLVSWLDEIETSYREDLFADNSAHTDIL